MRSFFLLFLFLLFFPVLSHGATEQEKLLVLYDFKIVKRSSVLSYEYTNYSSRQREIFYNPSMNMVNPIPAARVEIAFKRGTLEPWFWFCMPGTVNIWYLCSGYNLTYQGTSHNQTLLPADSPLSASIVTKYDLLLQHPNDTAPPPPPDPDQ
jgi:hypothetical protein